MKVQWYGQSSFALSASTTVFIDPFGDMSPLTGRGIRWDYPAIPAGTTADILLVTHEHLDHNAVDALSGRPQLIRSAAGTFATRSGEVVGIASEHDPVAGTQRGANVVYRWTMDGLRVCHLGDLGQAALRVEQAAAIGEIDLLFVPVGGSATIDGAAAAAAVRQLAPRWAVPMHYRTPAIGFLEPVDGFLQAMADHEVVELTRSWFDTRDLPQADNPVVVLPAPPPPIASAV